MKISLIPRTAPARRESRARKTLRKGGVAVCFASLMARFLLNASIALRCRDV